MGEQWAPEFYDEVDADDPEEEHEEAEVLEPKEAKRRSKIIEEARYFHGYLPRQRAVELLKRNGDFLVRESNIQDEKGVDIVLSIKWDGEHRHFRAQLDYRGYFSIDGHKHFRTIMDLVQFHVFNNRSLSRCTGAKLRRPIGLQPWELLDTDIEMMPVETGKGCFGTVYRGVLKLKDGNLKHVAIKTCEKPARKERKEFLREARIMRETQHPNIIEFIGICVFEAPLKLVMGLAEQGNLHKYLRDRAEKEPKIPLRQKIRFGLDASRGLEYLSGRQIIHMDIAARNCLLTAEQASGELKLLLCDFGLSRQAERYTVATGDHISQRWAAPELLKDNKASSLTDVWAFGILLWEIFSDGMQPYPNLQCDTNLDFYLTEENKRMEPDPSCPPMIGKLMTECWDFEPDTRPKFTDCRELMEQAYHNEKPFKPKKKNRDVRVFF